MENLHVLIKVTKCANETEFDSFQANGVRVLFCFVFGLAGECLAVSPFFCCRFNCILTAAQMCVAPFPDGL